MKYFGYTAKNEVENKAWKIVDADEKTLGHVMPNDDIGNDI